METGPIQQIEDVDREPKLIGKITVVRHGHTKTYEKDISEVPKDTIALTEGGVNQIEQTADKLIASGRITSRDAIKTFDTPRARTKDSLGIIANRTGIDISETRTSRSIRDVDLIKPEENEAAWKLNQQKKIAGAAEGNPFGWETFWLQSDETNDEDFALEPRERVKRRAGIALAAAIKHLFVEQNTEEKIPHLVGSAHFETMNPLLLAVFPDIDVESIIVQNADAITLDVLSQNDPGEVLIRVGFTDLSRVIRFNLKNRTIEQYE